MTAKTAAEANKDNKNAGFASTEKKFRLAVQSISDFVASKADNPEDALKWVEVQERLIKNLEATQALHRAHKEFWHGKPEED